MSKAAEILIQYHLLSGQTERDVIHAMEHYARLMIESDRKKVISECTEYKEWVCDNCCADSIGYIEADRDKIKNLPIELT